MLMKMFGVFLCFGCFWFDGCWLGYFGVEVWIRWLKVFSEVLVFLFMVIMICLYGIVVMLLVVKMLGSEVLLWVLMMILLCGDSLMLFLSYLVLGSRLICMKMFFSLIDLNFLELWFLYIRLVIFWLLFFILLVRVLVIILMFGRL